MYIKNITAAPWAHCQIPIMQRWFLIFITQPNVNFVNLYYLQKLTNSSINKYEQNEMLTFSLPRQTLLIILQNYKIINMKSRNISCISYGRQSYDNERKIYISKCVNMVDDKR